MIQIQPLTNFNGFGIGDQEGEYFHSQGMTRSQNGIVPGWKIIASIDDSSLSGLGLMNWITQCNGIGLSSYAYAMDAAGKIYSSLGGTGAWALAYTPFYSANGNGLFGGPDGYLYFLSQDYLGRYDGQPNNTTGTVAVTNGSPNVVGTGTSWGAGVANRKITINGVDYFILSWTDSTHITLTQNYVGSTASGLSFSIWTGWQEKFQLITSHLPAVTTLRGTDAYEDLVIFANGYTFGTYNMTTFTLGSDSFTLPNNFNALIAKSGKTGALCAANVGNRSVALLWNGTSDRSIQPWIWFNENIKAVVPWRGIWLIITTKRIYVSNGYTAEVFINYFPDGKVNQSAITANLLPGGADIVDNKLVFFGTVEGFNRQKSGLYILDLDTKLWNFVPVANGCLLGVTAGAVFFDSNFRTHLSYKTTTPTKTVLGYLSNAAPTTSFVIQEAGQGNSRKVAEGVQLNLDLDPKEITRQPITFDVLVKVANSKQLIYGYAQTNSASSAANQLKVDGTVTGYNNAEVGDEVTILEGVNAGQIRHITAIANQDTNTETWTLDSNLTGGNTENGIRVQVSPFKLTKKGSFSSASKLRDLYFPVTKQLQGKKFLIKTIFDNVGVSIPELTETDLITNDLGILP